MTLATGDLKPGDLNKEAAKSAQSFKWHATVAANNALQTQPLEYPMSAFATRIRPHVQAELDISVAAEREGFGDLAFHHLERAHVLAQPATLQHVRVHWRMFRFALRQRLAAEAFGQVLRMLLAGPLTIVGILPTGNTGGSSINGFMPMPVPADLQRVINAARGGSDDLAEIDGLSSFQPRHSPASSLSRQVPRHRVHTMRFIVTVLLSVALTGISLLGIAASCAGA